MKKLTLLAVITALSFSALAEGWKLDPMHSKIHFTSKYLFISEVDGEFGKFDGTFSSTKSDWTDLSADVTVDVKSISTDNEMRDNHLKSDDFFNAEKYPVIKFKSKSMKMLDKNKYVLSGDLTIRDVTKTVELPVVYGGTVKDPFGNVKAGFKATGKIDRKQFGLKYDNAAATGEAVVGDEVEFNLNIVLIKQ